MIKVLSNWHLFHGSNLGKNYQDLKLFILHFATMRNRPIKIYHELLIGVRHKMEEHNRWKLNQVIAKDKYKRIT